MENNKKKKLIIVIIVGIILLICLVLFFTLKKEKYTVLLDTDGGIKIANIEIKDGEIIKLPKDPTKEGYIFGGWTNKNGIIITEGIKITEDITLKALWINKDAEIKNITFDTDGGNNINKIIFEKGKAIKLPKNPTKEGYIFAGWINETGKIVTAGMLLSENVQLKALWINKNAKIRTITFDTGGGNNIDKIVVENNKIVHLPVNPIKEGYIFDSWVDGNGVTITNNTIITENITLKALWKNPYTCPTNCTPSADSSTCTKIETTALVKTFGCPNGYTLIENQCLDLKTKYDRDASSEYGGNPRGDGQCLSTEGAYDEIFGLGVTRMCAKKTAKVSSMGCPKGYTKDDNICKKTTTLKCTAN